MDTPIPEKTRKRQVAFLCIGLTLPLAFIFLLVDIVERNALEILTDGLTAVVLITCYVAIKRTRADLLVYRCILALLSLIFLYNVAIGADGGTILYWLFPFPMVFVFFLGKRQGAAFSGVFFVALCLLVLNPFSFAVHAYDINTELRFLISLLLVAIIACVLEASREKYERLLVEKNATLHTEKQRLEQALGEIKTLSGLIPICSSCKKIRNDRGYWQQVEIYIRDRSDANFSHSICPDCAAEFYSDYLHNTKNKRGGFP